MDASEIIRKYKQAFMFLLIVATVTISIQQYVLRSSISKLSVAFSDLHVIFLEEQASRLAILKKIESNYKNSNNGSETLANIIELQKDAVSSYLQSTKTPLKAKSALAYSLNCEPRACRARAPNKTRNKMDETVVAPIR